LNKFRHIHQRTRERLSEVVRVVRAPTSWRRVVLAVTAAFATDLALAEPAWPTLHEHGETARSEVLGRGAARAQPARIPANYTEDELDHAIRRQRVCVASEGWSAGALGSVVLYRKERVGDRVRVGYFVYWSTERPWGNNELTHMLLPALAIDAVYSHFLFVFPGVQRGLYGAGDIEGALVEYYEGVSGLVPTRAFADDATHHPVRLSPRDFVDAEGDIVFMTEAWSHQLGAREAVRRSPEADSIRCFEGNALAPMSDDTASAFRLGNAEKPRRARPAWSAHID